MPCRRRPLRAGRLRGGLFPLRGLLRPDRRLSRFWTLLRDLTGRPLTGRLLTGRPLTGRLLTGDTFNYRKAYGKLRGGTLPELGGNFRLCAVDQKRSFFLRVGPFLDLLCPQGPLRADRLTGRPRFWTFCPLRDLSPLQGGSLTGMCPFIKKDDEEAYGKAGRLRKPLTGRTVLTGRAGPYGKGPVPYGSLHKRRTTMGRLGAPYGEDGPYGKDRSLGMGPFTEKDDERAYGKVAPLRGRSYIWEGPLHPFTRQGRRRGLWEGWALTGNGGTLREGSLTRRPLTRREVPGKLTGSFTRIGREFPLVCRRPKRAVFWWGWAVSGPSAL